MKRPTILSLLGYCSLLVLLVLELILRYDTWVRQIALAVTDLFALAALWSIARYMRRRGYALPWSVVWFSALGVWFDGMGNFLHLYANVSWWDKLAHAVGAGAVAAGIFVLVQMFQKRGTIVLGLKMRSLFVLSITVLLTVLYEISEYLGDLWFQTHRVTDLYDTVDDLLWDLLATVLVILIVQIFRKKSTYQDSTE
ncbi:MAG: hypothetical protein V1778_01865 [bacterium]